MTVTMELDPQGFLKDWRAWDEHAATFLAATQQIELTAPHWEIIWLAREFYQKFDHAPSQRPLAKFIKTNLGAEQATSIYLMQLFGSSPAKVVSLIAGLPKPKNCL